MEIKTANLLAIVIMLLLLVAADFSQTVKLVKIGNQEWMVSNLDVNVFRNGDAIPEAKTPAEWENAGKQGTPAWCYYEIDPANETVKYTASCTTGTR